MLLKEYVSNNSKISIFEKYAIFSVAKGRKLDQTVANEIRTALKIHYPRSPFVIIREELHELEVDFSVYKKRAMRNLKGLAIVSSNEAVRKRAIEEQSLFDDSFAFFTSIDDAKSWADTFVFI
ncbi:hypothetical protein ACFQO1_05970 [Jejudonia soesokkakensis]|uniref:STAS/SEC14 domain-containing protein n=1 Tax=Jejudonia soesokkakensis TaxID=1323432 RepID=A0ABW2MQR6_9FLAO